MDSSELERFEAVILPHLDSAYTLARYLTRHDQDAEDIVQEASLRAFRHFTGFRGETGRDARAWLLTIVRNAVFSMRKRHRAEDLTTEFDEELHSEAVSDDQPGAAVERESARQSLHRALDRLGPDYREVIVLRELQELSYKEISDVTGVPVGTVMSRLSRARQKLATALGGEADGD